MIRTPLRAIGAALVLAALLLASCSTSGSDDAKDTTTTAADDTTTTAGDDEVTTTEADDGGDADAQARAETVDLTVSDFPDGWEASEADDSESGALNDCSDTFRDDSNELAVFRDDNFDLGDLDAGDGSRMSVETKVFESEDAASAEIAPFADPDVLACIDEGLKSQFGGVSGDVQIDGEFTADDYPATTADEAVAASAQYAITADGTTTNLIVAVLLLRTGDLASQVLIFSVGDGLEFSDLEGPVTRVEELQAAA